MNDLERFNRLAVGRKKSMIELKCEVKGLLAALGRMLLWQRRCRCAHGLRRVARCGNTSCHSAAARNPRR